MGGGDGMADDAGWRPSEAEGRAGLADDEADEQGRRRADEAGMRGTQTPDPRGHDHPRKL